MLCSALVLVCGCDGLIGGGGPGSEEAFVCLNPSDVAVGSTPVRRLTNVEYENTVRDLFGGSVPSLREQPADAVREGTFENDAMTLGPSDVRIARYEDAAMALGEHAVTDETANAAIMPCAPADGATQCGRQFVETFGRRAFRRSMSPDEIARWSAFFDSQRRAIDFNAAIQLTVAAMLQSPQFLYRVELGEPGAGGAEIPLTQHELANRLSYFLWESMPDDELLAAADAGQLQTDAQIEAQAQRMLDDDRASVTVRNFHRQWLYLDRVLGEDKVEDQFPMWSSEVQESVYEESLLFVEKTVLEGGTLEDLLTSNVAYVDAAAANLYGVDPPSEPWSAVELDPTERAGILSRIAFLAGNAHEANGSPPLRGIYVMERLMCETRSSPPANADLSPPVAEEGAGPFTNRDLFEQRTSPTTCQGCHVRIDGFGFGFEEYDAAGLYREFDNGLPVDASGFADGIGNDSEFDDAIELQNLLAESQVVHDCVAEKWLTYSLGRQLEPRDACQLQDLQDTFMQSGGTVRDLLVNITLRPEFRLRNGEGQ